MGGKANLFLQNRVLHFVASISMEIYLCHMFVFRIMEKLKLTHLTGNEIINYMSTSVATVLGAIIMAFALKKILDLVRKKKQDAKMENYR